MARFLAALAAKPLAQSSNPCLPSTRRTEQLRHRGPSFRRMWFPTDPCGSLCRWRSTQAFRSRNRRSSQPGRCRPKYRTEAVEPSRSGWIGGITSQGAGSADACALGRGAARWPRRFLLGGAGRRFLGSAGLSRARLALCSRTPSRGALTSRSSLTGDALRSLTPARGVGSGGAGTAPGVAARPSCAKNRRSWPLSCRAAVLSEDLLPRFLGFLPPPPFLGGMAPTQPRNGSAGC